MATSFENAPVEPGASAHAAANSAAARALVGALAAEPGEPPRPVVVSPGSRSAPLVLALHAASGIAVHVVLDERIAGFVALGLARAQGRAAVAVCTSGTAGAHYLPAAIEAFEAEVPLVLVTADRPAELQEVGAPQTTNQLMFFGSHVRARLVAPTPRASSPQAAAWARSAAQALRIAEGSAERGPVHINVPFAEPLVAAAADAAEPCAQPVARAPRRPAPSAPGLSPEALARLVAQLRNEPLGVVACGPWLGAAAPPQLGHKLAALAERLGWPLWLDGCSQLRCEHATLPYDLIVGAPSSKRLPRARTVLRLGHALTSKRANTYLSHASSAQRGVLVQTGPRLRDPYGHIGEVVVAAPEVVVTQLLDALANSAPAPESQQALAAWHHAATVVRRHIAHLGCHDAPLWEGEALVVALRALVPGTLMQLGSSLAVRDFDALVLASDCEVACNRGVNGIDGTLSCALGLALGAPARKVVALVGELTFLHDVAALQAAHQVSAALVILVINNAGGGIFRQLPIAAHQDVFARYFETPQKADIAALSRAMGARHTAVARADALLGAVAAAQKHATGVTVIEVMCADDAQHRRARWLASCYEQFADESDGG